MNIDFALKFLVVEEDLSSALRLKIMLEEIGYAQIKRVQNSTEALEYITSNEPDFIVMNIDVKGKLSGIEIGKKIKHLEIPILFIASFKVETDGQESHNFYTVGHFVELIDKYILQTSINQIIHNSLGNRLEKKSLKDSPTNFSFKESIFLKKNNNYHKIKISDLTYIEADDKYCIIHSIDGSKFIVRQSLSSIEKEFSSDYFFRIHRKYLVLTELIETIDFSEHKLRLGEAIELPVSRSYMKELNSIIKKY